MLILFSDWLIAQQSIQKDMSVNENMLRNPVKSKEKKNM